ncbi:hypothetical protein EST38_g4662 [Candolleomyces aberdarensis]|uniref:Uncharacterized protein n=1 Tax=Candolleomyces aberdarensis TaxID=2316362 RepID=A0A4Q2DPT4_9AGAR|nr:hypothetical protein EST38_g4662 [Candolleomyces aberdarensis]
MGLKDTQWYTVWELRRDGRHINRTVFTCYSDYGHLTSDKGGVSGFRNHRKFSNLVSTVVWLLSRGDSRFLMQNSLSDHAAPTDHRLQYDTPDTELRNLDPNVILLSDEEDGIPEDLPQLRGSSSKSANPLVINLVTPTKLISQQPGVEGVEQVVDVSNQTEREHDPPNLSASPFNLGKLNVRLN